MTRILSSFLTIQKINPKCYKLKIMISMSQMHKTSKHLEVSNDALLIVELMHEKLSSYWMSNHTYTVARILFKLDNEYQ